jgi:hypothetical protein
MYHINRVTTSNLTKLITRTLAMTTHDREKVCWRNGITLGGGSRHLILLFLIISHHKLPPLFSRAPLSLSSVRRSCLSSCIMYIKDMVKVFPQAIMTKKDRYKSTLLRFDSFPCRLELDRQKDRFIWTGPTEMSIDFGPRTSLQAHPVPLSSLQS